MSHFPTDPIMMEPSSTEAHALSRRERERRRRRQAMLQAAEAVFAEKGYARATLDEIAERAEFGKGTLYNYFEGGKQAILLAVFEEIYTNLCNLIRSSFEPKDHFETSFRETFHDFIETFLTFFLERQALFMVLIKEECRMTFSDDPERTAYFHDQDERLVNALVPALEAAMAAGELRTLPPHAVAHMIVGNIKGLLTSFLMHQEKEICQAAHKDSPMESTEQAAHFLTTVLCDGLLPPLPHAATE